MAAGYSLSLGNEGRAQVSAIVDVVADTSARLVQHVADTSRQIADASAQLSFANVYSAIGVMTGAAVDSAAGLQVVPEGIVVEPATSKLSDEEQRARIEASFSDKVMIRPDPTKKSGTITPVFKSGNGDTYMYMIVPVQK